MDKGKLFVSLIKNTFKATVIILFLIIFSACEKIDTSSQEDENQSQHPNQSHIATTSITPKNQTLEADTFIPNTDNLQVLDVSEANLNGKNGIRVTLSTPIDTTVNFQPYFSVYQDIGANNEQIVEGAWTAATNGKHLWFIHTEPKTRYRVAINPGLKAHNGSVLQKTKSVEISTRRLLPSINFDSDGLILPVGYSTGLPIVTINIPAVDVDFFRIQTEHIANFLVDAQSYNRSGWSAQRLKKYGDLVHSGRFDLNAPKNTRTKRDLNIKHIDALKTAGLYFAVMREAGDYDDKEITWFSVTDIGLHVRQYNDQLDIHAASLTTGKPLAHVDIELLSRNDKLIQKNTTTNEGLASFTGKALTAHIVVAKDTNNKHASYTLLNLQKPALDLSDFNLGSRPQLPMDIFLYSPRDLYRPGEEAIFSGLLRDGDGHKTHMPILTADMINPNGSKVKTFKWKSDGSGYYQKQWQIPTDAATGKWQLRVSGALKKPVNYTFNVEEFLPERLKLTLANKQERTNVDNANTPVSIEVLGEYLYGAPAAGNRFSTMLYTSTWRSPIKQLKDFEFGRVNASNFTPQIELDDITLDEEGKSTLTLQPHWQKNISPLKVLVSGSLYESGGRAITRSHPVLIWPQKELFGIRPHFTADNLKANSTATFDIVNADIDGNKHAASDVQVTLIKEDRQYFWEYNQHRGWHWEWSEKEYTVTSENIVIKDNDIRTIGFPVNWGNYRLEVKNNQTGALSSIRFFAGHNWYYDWKNAKNASGARPDKVSLALDKASYKVGDIAQLSIMPPAAGEALILVEGDGPLWSKKITVPAQGTHIELPIDASWQQHNLYITALLLQPSGNHNAITPKRSLGILHLPLNRNDRKLIIDINTPENTQPETQLLAKLKITPEKKAGNTQPIDALTSTTFVTLAAVDVGVLNISNFKTPDPFTFFFEPRRYQVDAKDVYNNVIEVTDAPMAKQRFGGDGDITRGGQKPQSDVRIVSLFHGPVVVDANGYTEIPIQLPDFNGRLRLMAVAFNDDSFGSADKEITIAAPIVAEIAMPRFLAMDDTSTLALDIQNMTDATETLSVQFTVTGAAKLLTHNTNSTITLKSKAKDTLLFPIEATDFTGTAKITATIQSEHNGDITRTWQLGMRPAYPALTNSKQQLLKPGEHFSLAATDVPEALPETLQASIAVSSTVNLNINEHVKKLLNYPYGCLEQTASRGYPLAFATPAEQQRFNLPHLDEGKRRSMMQQGIDRIISFQKSNGSFGLWSKDSNEEHWLTVYAVDFLLSAKQAGMDVPDAQLNKAIKRLSYYLNSRGVFAQQRWSRNSNHYAFATRAYAAYVLATRKQAPLGSLRTLYQQSFEHAKTSLAKTHMGLALILMGDKQNGEHALTSALNTMPTIYRYWGDYGSEIRDTGMMIHLLTKHGTSIPNHQDQALTLSLTLRNALQNRRWLSTQERTSLFLSGIALQHNANTPWSASWQLNPNNNQASAVAINTSKSWQKLLDDHALNQGFDITSTHNNVLYLTSTVSGYGRTAPPPSSQGLSIERNWYTAKGELITPSQAEVGELYLVHLAIASNDQRVPDALAINLLPAGFEVENQNLEHSIKIDNFNIGNQTVAQLQKNTDIKTIEYRDDRVVAAINHQSYRSSHVFFMVRAVTPGDYQVPPPIVEDMYRPEIRGVGHTIERITVINP